MMGRERSKTGVARFRRFKRRFLEQAKHHIPPRHWVLLVCFCLAAPLALTAQPFKVDSSANVTSAGVTATQVLTTGASGPTTGSLLFNVYSGATMVGTFITSIGTTVGAGASNGVLYSRTGDNEIWLSYRFAGPSMGMPSCALGAWEIRVWTYTIGAGFTLNPEITGSPFTPIGTCSYTEMSGFYDPQSGDFTFQGVPTGGSNYWQSNIYGFNLNYPTTFDLVVPWGTDGIHYAWDEHANINASQTYIVWSSSAGVTANNYDGSKLTFGPGVGHTGYLPLDKWMAALPRFTDALGVVHLGQIGNALRLTYVNAPNSPERTMTCALDGGCTSTAVFSGGNSSYPQTLSSLSESIKDTSGTAALYGVSFLPFTTGLLGSTQLNGSTVLK
jgi:hypothetical protein